jgi:hypothetical protein
MEKYRLTFAGGDAFKNKYLKKFSERETDPDFSIRSDITYVPAFAKAAVIDIQNSIFNRLIDVTRRDGSESYQQSVRGTNGGVDNEGRSMNNFVGHSILPELLPMRTVGVYVDMPRGDSVTRLQDERHPYLYTYRAEEIKSLKKDINGNLVALVLEGNANIFDDEFQVVTETEKRWRHLLLTEAGVRVTIYDEEGPIEQTILPLTKIPFVIFQLPHSLLVDVADYQISMLNIASSDMNYGIRSNFPFYTEQYNLASSNHIRTVKNGDDDGTAAQASTAKDKEVESGVMKGRRYAQGMDRPGFIHPSPEPLEVSMKKQEAMKKEIRQLVNLAVANMDPGRESAESKKIDERGLSAGLSAIGLELERGERLIAEIWSMYEQSNTATVFYPEDYDAKSDDDRMSQAEKLAELTKPSPSFTFQKELNKQQAKVLLGNKVDAKTMKKILKEIDDAKVQYVDPETIVADVETGLVSRPTASDIRGYGKDEAVKAEAEHAKRAAAIIAAQSQAGARGVPDLDPNPKSSKEEKKNSQNREKDLDSKDGKRGKE